MSEISRSKLFGKLNAIGFKAIESATTFCKLRGNPYVEIVHWFHQILQLQDSDLHQIIKKFDLQPARIAKGPAALLSSALAGGARTITVMPHKISVAATNHKNAAGPTLA